MAKNKSTAVVNQSTAAAIEPIKFANIVTDPHLVGGRHRLIGTNITVDRVVMLADQGWSKERMIKMYEQLSASAIDEMLAFHAAGLNPPAKLIEESDLSPHTLARLKTSEKKLARDVAQQQEAEANSPAHDTFARERAAAAKNNPAAASVLVGADEPEHEDVFARERNQSKLMFQRRAEAKVETDRQRAEDAANLAAQQEADRAAAMAEAGADAAGAGNSSTADNSLFDVGDEGKPADGPAKPSADSPKPAAAAGLSPEIAALANESPLEGE